MYGRGGNGFTERGRGGNGFMERGRGGNGFIERGRGGNGFIERGRGGNGFMERGRDGGPGYDSFNYGGDSYRAEPEPWIPPFDEPDRGSGYFDRPKRGRNEYSEPERGYRGRPQNAQSWGRGDPRGSFRGNSGPTRPAGRARHLSQPPNPEEDQFPQLRPFAKLFFYGGGLKLKRDKNLIPIKGVQSKEVQKKISKNNGPPAAKKMKVTAEKSGNAEELAQITTSDGEEDGTQEEKEHAQSSSIKHQEPESPKEIVEEHKLLNRIQFYCNLCKFRTFYEEDWNTHLKDSFHHRHVIYVKKRLPSRFADCLEAYLDSYFQRAKQSREKIGDYNSTINQIYRNNDLTLGLGMEHFVKKVEVARCDACDLFLPMDMSSLQEHIKSISHKDNCQPMILKSKLTAINLMRDKDSKKKLHQYIDENPLVNDPKEKMRSGCSRDSAPAAKESGELAFITLSDSEGEEEEGSFQASNHDKGASSTSRGKKVSPSSQAEILYCLVISSSRVHFPSRSSESIDSIIKD